MSFDPEEIVSAPIVTAGPLTLRTAVRKIVAMTPADQALATVFRSGEPSCLTIDDIKTLATRPEFQLRDDDTGTA
jgi:hypothetical protein